MGKAHRGEEVSSGGSGAPSFPSAEKRRYRPMCRECINGNHRKCESFRCPCVCNDDNFRFRRSSGPASPIDNRMVQQNESGPEDYEIYKIGLKEILKQKRMIIT